MLLSLYLLISSQFTVDILLNAAGNAPIMKQRKWAVDPMKDICWVAKFIHKYLKLDGEEKLFLYVNQVHLLLSILCNH